MQSDARSVRAVVRVDIGEVADIDEMARLVDGEIGHYGYTVFLVKVGDPEPAYRERLHFGKFDGVTVDRQFGYSAKPGVDQPRYYEVRVDRD
jgi:hypothetical protein